MNGTMRTEPVIERNTPVPIEQTRRFTTARDEQESVQIRVYQGTERTVEGNELLGQFEFSGFRKAPRGDVAIDVLARDADAIELRVAVAPQAAPVDESLARLVVKNGWDLLALGREHATLEDVFRALTLGQPQPESTPEVASHA